MRLPDGRQLEQVLDEIRTSTDRIRQDGPELLRRARTDSRDGYPTSSLTGSTSGGNLADPVGDLVERRIDQGHTADPIRATVAVMVHELNEAVRRIRAADSARARALPPTERKPGDVGCVICHRYGITSPVHKAGRCRADYEYRRRHNGGDAPEQVVLERERVRRVRATG